MSILRGSEHRVKVRNISGVIGAAISGALMAASFPPLEKAALAWVAFVPLLIASRYARPRAAFLLGTVSGAIYWLLASSWLLRLLPHASWALVMFGWIVLALYAALYTALFTWAYSSAWRLVTQARFLFNLLLPVAGAIVWAGLEYTRCRFLTGYPWNPLGVSQYRNLPVIQIAEWTGVHGVSALVMLFNISLAMTLSRYVDPGERRRGGRLEIGVAALLLAICWRIGIERERSFRHMPGTERELNVAVLQTGVPQYVKWDDGMAQDMFDNLREGIREAALKAFLHGGRPPDIVVLPETVFPYYEDHPSSRKFVREQLHELSAPILAGVMAAEFRGGREHYFNRSILYLPGQGLPRFYDKQHLVPFGEVIPLSRAIPWLERFAPLGWNCTPGEEATVLRLPDSDVPFSVTICFEDAFPYISRRFARAGARLLVNQTNDAWFDPSSASRQHLAQGVFRSVETRLPTVRAANTGVSAWIDRNGQIREMLPPADSRTPKRMTAAWQVAPAPDGSLTWFVRYGYWVFNYSAAGMALAALALAWFTRKCRTEEMASENSA